MNADKKIAIITGGAQGIGKGIVQHFLENGIVVIAVDKDKEAGKDLENEFALLGDLHFIACDVSKESNIKKVIKFAIKQFKKIDYVINNAGISEFGSLEKTSLKYWNKVLSINLTSMFLFTKHAEKFLRKSKGAIVNIASTRAHMSEPNTLAYSATKGGIVALTHSLAISLGPDVRVNCISPGWIDVSEWAKKSKKHKEKYSAKAKQQHPVGRIGTPHDIAALTSYLVSEDASFITGQEFIVDGGMTKKMIYAS